MCPASRARFILGSPAPPINKPSNPLDIMERGRVFMAGPENDMKTMGFDVVLGSYRGIMSTKNAVIGNSAGHKHAKKGSKWFYAR